MSGCWIRTRGEVMGVLAPIPEFRQDRGRSDVGHSEVRPVLGDLILFVWFDRRPHLSGCPVPRFPLRRQRGRDLVIERGDLVEHCISPQRLQPLFV